jgi:hypothetical protein
MLGPRRAELQQWSYSEVLREFVLAATLRLE